MNTDHFESKRLSEYLYHAVGARLTAVIVWPVVLVVFMIVDVQNACAVSDRKQVAGWVEKAVIMPQGVHLRAKLDTGARTSSLNAQDVERFTHNGKSWVKFHLTNDHGDILTIQEPVVRQARIKRHFGARQLRNVIRLQICVGDVFKQVDVSLIDRAGFNYQLLIGRNFLANTFLVDAAHKYLVPAVCAAEER